MFDKLKVKIIKSLGGFTKDEYEHSKIKISEVHCDVKTDTLKMKCILPEYINGNNKSDYIRLAVKDRVADALWDGGYIKISEIIDHTVFEGKNTIVAEIVVVHPSNYPVNVPEPITRWNVTNIESRDHRW